MQMRHVTLTDFLAGQFCAMSGDSSHAGPDILLAEIAQAVSSISAIVSRSALDHPDTGRPPPELAAHATFVAMCERSAAVAGFASVRTEAARAGSAGAAHGHYLVVFDALDDASHAAVNASAGTVFSVLRREQRQPAADAAFLRAGSEQVAAGYAIYGPSTLLVLTVGNGTHGFTLDRDANVFVLTHPSIRLPEEPRGLAVDHADEPFWEPPVLRYVRECRSGSGGERQRDFSARWTGSMVADVHRLLMNGGVYLSPRERRQPARAGRVRLLHEANPLALVVEQAGGLAGTGRARLLELPPEALHQRVPLILGSRCEVERLERYHREYESGADTPFVSPLFNERSLFRPEARA